MLSIGPYSEFFQEIKRKSQQSALYAFFKKGENPQPGTSSEK
jgi:hypothetical protein